MANVLIMALLSIQPASCACFRMSWRWACAGAAGQVFQKREKGKLCPATAPSVNSLCRHIPKQNLKDPHKVLLTHQRLLHTFSHIVASSLPEAQTLTEGNLEAIFQRPGLQHQQVSPTYVQGATKASRNGNMTKECMHQNNGFEAQPPHSKIDSITHTHGLTYPLCGRINQLLAKVRAPLLKQAKLLGRPSFCE